MQNTKSIFGRRLRVLRKSRHWTLEELGEKAGLGYKHVADVERGVKAPSFDAIDRIAAVFGVHPYELFLPSSEPGVDTKLRFRHLIQEFELVDSPAIKQFLVNVLGLARNLQTSITGSAKGGVAEHHKR
jgi:transcriptional regulator with XRE-family HTH domain